MTQLLTQAWLLYILRKAILNLTLDDAEGVGSDVVIAPQEVQHQRDVKLVGNLLTPPNHSKALFSEFSPDIL
jgi:hypothetical protein